MGNYTYFTDKEVTGLEGELVAALDKARHMAGVPFVIVSGKRDEVHNKSVGGASDSAHLTGWAADVRTGDSRKHGLVLKGLYAAGFNRVGQYFEINAANGTLRPLSIHADMDPTKDRDVAWFRIISKINSPLNVV